MKDGESNNEYIDVEIGSADPVKIEVQQASGRGPEMVFE